MHCIYTVCMLYIFIPHVYIVCMVEKVRCYSTVLCPSATLNLREGGKMHIIHAQLASQSKFSSARTQKDNTVQEQQTCQSICSTAIKCSSSLLHCYTTLVMLAFDLCFRCIPLDHSSVCGLVCAVSCEFPEYPAHVLLIVRMQCCSS